jgi:hypothetical protein
LFSSVTVPVSAATRIEVKPAARSLILMTVIPVIVTVYVRRAGTEELL